MVRERLPGILRPDAPDDAGIAYRAATAGCVVVSVIAAVMQDAVSAPTGWLAVFLVPLGFVFSYARRGKRNVAIKIVLTVGLFLAFAAFLQGVRGATNVDDTRAPLVGVFLWVQVMHSFDVPRARDLSFSVAASVVLIALAGSLAFSTGFLVFVLIHAALLIASMVLAYRAELEKVGDNVAPSHEVDRASARTRTSHTGLGRRIAALGAATLLSTAVVFVFLPRLPAQQLASLPFSFAKSTPLNDFVGDVALPGGGDESDVGSSEAFDPETYFGYGEAMSLRVRGQLSDDLVMRVRAPRPSLYRAQAFDVYEEGRWTSSDEELNEVASAGADSIFVPDSPEGDAGGSELVQTFYVERDLPNIVFHAYQANELYVSETRVRVDDFGSIRLPFTVEKDTIYSVISRVPDRDPNLLRFAAPVDAADPAMRRYLQVPDSLGEKFHELSLEITGPHDTAVAKAEAVQAWLHETKRYRLDIPRDPPGRDPVDVFVFERDEGFCEQIATTMALMLRASGVPTRIVTGFGEGERNPFTGYWEVRNSDAHAWVEVLYPGLGWIEYDPTFGIPESNAANTTFMLAPLAKVTTAVPAAIRSAGRLVSATARALPGPAWLGTILLIAATGTLVLFGLRARTRRGIAARGETNRVIRAWLSLERALAARGLRREDHETALEFARRASPLVGANVDELAAAFSALRYGRPNGVDVGALEEQVEWAARGIKASR